MTPRGRQRGSIALTLGLLLIGLVSILGLVEVGYLYWAHRNVQKIADLAALSGAQRLTTCTAANGSNSAAIDNAQKDNHFTGNVVADCGYWSPEIPGKEHFGAADEDHPTNAVRTTATLPLSPFFGFADFNGVSATAIAANRGDPVAAFSVGSRLLGVDKNSALNDLLDSVLGTRLGLKLLSYEGVANTSISLLGLKNLLHLDAGTVHEVLDTQVEVGTLLDAIVTLMGKSDNAASLNISAIKHQVSLIQSEVGDIQIRLGDILNVNSGTSNPDRALDVDVNAGDLINAALMAANSKHAVQLDLPIDLLGVAKVGLKLAVVEPPKIGIGRAGYDTNGRPLTLAHTAQIRLRMDVKLVDSNLLGGGKVLLNIPLVKVTLPDGQLSDIPLNLEVVPAEAWLDSLQCHQPDPDGGRMDLATIKAKPGVLTLFLGNLPDSTYENHDKRWQDIVDDAIADGSAYAELLDVDIHALLINPKAKLKAYASAPVVRPVAKPLPFEMPDGNNSLPQSSPVDTGQDLLSSALSGLLSPNNLKIKLKLDALGPVGDVISGIANGVLTIVGNLLPVLGPMLKPVLGTLDHALIGPLLHVLGVNVGAANVHLMSVNCDTGAQLVY